LCIYLYHPDANEKPVERLPILVTGNGVEKLLGVPDVQNLLLQIYFISRGQKRNDYKELLELSILFIIGMSDKRILSIKAPGGLHQARWMGRVIYAIKILMFKA